MPCDYRLYPDDWKQISLRVRAKAENRCEKCGVPNLRQVYRSVDGLWWWDTDEDLWRSTEDGSRAPDWLDLNNRDKPTLIVLTVAHLDRPGDVCQCEAESGRKCGNEEHLKAWCQSCHLSYDHYKHVRNARHTRFNRKAAGVIPGLETV